MQVSVPGMNMRIGVVSTLYPTLYNPTAGIFVKEELDNLSGQVEVRLIAPFPNHRWFIERHSQIDTPAYTVIRPFTLAFPRWFMQRFYPWSMAFMLRRIGREFFKRCDLIHAHNVFPEGVASVIAFNEKLPVIITAHGSDVCYFALKPHLKPGIIRASNSARKIICVSSYLAQNLKKLGVTAKTVVIPNGIDTVFYTPCDKTSASVYLGLDSRRPRILYAGNFVPHKGVEYLIMAMPAVLEKFPRCELVLLGAKPGTADNSPYRDLIETLKIGHVVKIVERMPHAQIPPWMHASDLLALPSITEGFGIVAAEALACGKPVVATKPGGPEDIIEEGMGFLVPKKDSGALAQAILEVLDGDSILDSKILAESARSRFSYDKVTEKIIEVYRDVIS